jgi:hypothetical protein
MGNFSKSTLLALTAGFVGAAMPINNGIRRGELTSNYLLGPLTSCVPPKNNQTCVTNGTDFHVYGGGGPEYAITADGRTTTYINPKTPPTQPSSTITWVNLATSIIGFCTSAVFCGVVCANRRRISNAVSDALGVSLLSQRDAEEGVEMTSRPPSTTNEGSRTSSPDSNHPPSAIIGHATTGNTTGIGGYRDV